ncbi:hypothetical protein CVT26_009204 [Gymnopilus dilepis]|uniref:CxC2-like cysteine cluster KDZ transposase-associated domain-containing protein n=1 Tax=Gymnopilus dilepis TaxID=231916 RepID=A0A409WUL1_9AGAR|nr:hypothetical protein CVT26_009204 [Gymnopilus dilepis]
MSAARLLSGRPSKRARQGTTRIAVVPDLPSDDGPLPLLRATYREEKTQPSTGRTYRSAPIPIFQDITLPMDDREIGLDADETLHDVTMKCQYVDLERTKSAQQIHGKKKKKKRRTLASARPIVHWKNACRDLYLDELLRWEGRGDAWSKGQTECYDCRARKASPPNAGEYRCADCSVPHLLCRDCCVRRHRCLPYHVIKKWTGEFFIKASLKALGLRFQLNHFGNACAKPQPSHAHFSVLHTNGLHEVAVDFCGCKPVSKVRQLLRRGLYPSSQNNPRTCATFELLQQLHMLSLTSKISTYDYYRALERLTDNTGTKPLKSKYRPLLRMIHEWRHLKMLKRGGRGHDPSGAAGTKEGELAILCPSCPHPGINLPDGWSNASDDQRFLYFVVLCIDANFRLKNQLISNYSVDPGLGIGMSYMVPRESFEEYVKSRAGDVDMTEDDKRGCGLQAVEQANTKFSKGLRYTGVSSVSCGRSEMILPCSVGNLSKGERYCVMDFSVASALRFVCAVLLVILSYDIACQWFVNFASRVANFWPNELKPPASMSFVPLIPKLHEAGHKKPKNHEQFSFNFCKGAGQTDGEGPERIWSAHNALGNATKTMGPGTRHDVLDDQFSFWNYEKYKGMGRALMRRYQKAVPERNRQTEAHRGFTASLKPRDVKRWEEMCELWDSSPFPRTLDSPYCIEGANITIQQVRKELAEEEKKQRENGITFHKTTPLMFITTALELEDSQRRLAWIVKHKDKDHAVIQEERQSLHKAIESWKQMRAIYMPGLAQYLEDQDRQKPGSVVDSDKAEEVVLWLPSTIECAKREAVCVKGLSAIEERLRTAQCHDSLQGICDTLRLKSRMVHFKNKNVRGQREGTRSREIINRVHSRARKFAACYRAARIAKLQLSGPGKWEDAYRPLRDTDIRSPQDPERVKQKKRRRGTYEDWERSGEIEIEDSGDDDDDDGERIDLLPQQRSKRDGTGQTRLSISWIWTVIPYEKASDDKEADKVIMAEWCRSRARVKRATEEVALLREEMRRVLAFLDWRATWWTTHRTSRLVEDIVLTEGLHAYCASQSSHQLALKATFQAIWKTPLDKPISEHIGSCEGNNKVFDHDSKDDEDKSESDDENDGISGSNRGDEDSGSEVDSDEGSGSEDRSDEEENEGDDDDDDDD